MTVVLNQPDQSYRRGVRYRLKRTVNSPSKIFAYLFLAAVCIAIIFPFYWMVRTAFTPAAQLITDAGQFFPSQPTLINFARVMGLTTREEAITAGGTGASIDFVRYTINSLL